MAKTPRGASKSISAASISGNQMAKWRRKIINIGSVMKGENNVNGSEKRRRHRNGAVISENSNINNMKISISVAVSAAAIMAMAAAWLWQQQRQHRGSSVANQNKQQCAGMAPKWHGVISAKHRAAAMAAAAKSRRQRRHRAPWRHQKRGGGVMAWLAGGGANIGDKEMAYQRKMKANGSNGGKEKCENSNRWQRSGAQQ